MTRAGGAFLSLESLLARNAREHPAHIALVQGDRRITYAALDALIDRVAAAHQRDRFGRLDVVAIAAATSIEYIAAFTGALRAGLTVAPLPLSSSSDALAAMIADCGARRLFLDRQLAQAMTDLALPS